MRREAGTQEEGRYGGGGRVRCYGLEVELIANAEYVPVLSVKKNDIVLLPINGISGQGDTITASVLGIMPISGSPTEQVSKITSFLAMADNLFAVGVNDDQDLEAHAEGRACMPRGGGLELPDFNGVLCPACAAVAGDGGARGVAGPQAWSLRGAVDAAQQAPQHGCVALSLTATTR